MIYKIRRVINLFAPPHEKTTVCWREGALFHFFLGESPPHRLDGFFDFFQIATPPFLGFE